MPLDGLVVPMVTLFNERGTVDPSRISKFTRGLLDDGVRHILVLGTTGERDSLDDQQREIVVERAAESVTFGSDVWATIAEETTEDAREFADIAEGVGASVLAVMGPLGAQPDPSEIAAHFRRLRSNTRLPILAYNAPQEVGYSLSSDLLLGLAREVVIQGVIEASGDDPLLETIARAAPEGFSVFGGETEAAFEHLGAGVHGVCSESGNVLPRLIVKLVDVEMKGDEKAAEPLQKLHKQLLDLIDVGPHPSVLKFLGGYLRESDEGYSEAHPPLTEEQQTKLREAAEPNKAALQEYA